MANIQENITISGYVTVKVDSVDKHIVSMTGACSGVGEQYSNFNVSILDKKAFKDNFVTCKEEINEFVEAVLDRQKQLLEEV